MEQLYQPDDETKTLLVSLKAFFFPSGEDAARGMRGVKTAQRGEMCSAPGARWTPFSADERIDATQSSFCWEARYGSGRFGSFMVTDAYEEGRGRLAVKLGGVIPVKKFSGRDFDKGEIQRYFSSIPMCPSMLLNHSTLEFLTAGKRTLRVRDRNDPTGATVDFEIGEGGRPVVCRAERPRMVGKQTVSTPWSGTCTEFQEWEGMRLARRVEACWNLPGQIFTYYRSEITSYREWP
jgi:hypothetical protein